MFLSRRKAIELENHLVFLMQNIIADTIRTLGKQRAVFVKVCVEPRLVYDLRGPMSSTRNFLQVLSRVMAVGLFFVSGIGKIPGYQDNLHLMSQNGVPEFFLPLVILLEVGGSIAIVFGFLTRFTSIFMCVFSVLSGFLFYQGYSHEHLMVWLKNISCAAGFLMLAVETGPAPWSIDALIASYLNRTKPSNRQLAN